MNKRYISFLKGHKLYFPIRVVNEADGTFIISTDGTLNEAMEIFHSLNKFDVTLHTINILSMNNAAILHTDFLTLSATADLAL